MTFEEYQRLIENALKARNNCKEDSWGRNYLQGVFDQILLITEKDKPNS